MDSSGITLYYTERLREFDAGLLKTGTISLFLPPGRAVVHEGGVCTTNCLQEHGLSQPVNIVASMTHMHVMDKLLYSNSFFHSNLMI